MASLVCRWLKMTQEGDTPASAAAAAAAGGAAHGAAPGSAAGGDPSGGGAGAGASQAGQQLDEAHYLRQLAKVRLLRSLVPCHVL